MIYAIKIGNQGVAILTALLPEPFKASVEQSLNNLLGYFTSLNIDGEEGGSRSEFSTVEFPIYLTFTIGMLIGALVAFFLLKLHYRNLSGMFVYVYSSYLSISGNRVSNHPIALV